MGLLFVGFGIYHGKWVKLLYTAEHILHQYHRNENKFYLKIKYQAIILTDKIKLIRKEY